MSNNQLKKFNHALTLDIINELDLPNNLRNKIFGVEGDINILSTLINNNENQNALRFLIFGLPTREAIWWGYLAAESEKTDSSPSVMLALENIAEWVKNPTEEKRDFNNTCLNKLNSNTATYWSAKSVEFSYGEPLNEIPKSITQEAITYQNSVYNSLNICVLSAPNTDEAHKKILRQGLHIAMGGNGRISPNIVDSLVNI